jgi:hypothetical protein
MDRGRIRLMLIYRPVIAVALISPVKSFIRVREKIIDIRIGNTSPKNMVKKLPLTLSSSYFINLIESFLLFIL